MVKNISIGRFFPGDSIIHRLDPRLKLYFIFMFIVSIFFIKSFLVFIPLAIFLFSNALLELLAECASQAHITHRAVLRPC